MCGRLVWSCTRCARVKHPFDTQNEGALIHCKIMGVLSPLPAGKFSAQLSDMLSFVLTMDHRQRPDSAALLANTSLINRARSLGVDLDPDEERSVLDSQRGSGRVSEEPKSASAALPSREMAPPGGNPICRELPANPHLRQQMRPADVSLKRITQRMPLPWPRPPAIRR